MKESCRKPFAQPTYERFDFWQDVVCRQICKLECERYIDGHFSMTNRRTTYRNCPKRRKMVSTVRKEKLYLPPKGSDIFAYALKGADLEAEFDGSTTLPAIEGLLDQNSHQTLKGGGEVVRLTNLHPAGEIEFTLPLVKPQGRVLGGTAQKDHILGFNLETVVIESEQLVVRLFWKAAFPFTTPLNDAREVQVFLSKAD